MLELKKILAQNVSKLLDTRPDISRLDLSRQMRVADGTLGRIKYGTGNPNAETIEAIAKYFRLQPWQLLIEGFDPSDPPQLAKDMPAPPKTQAGRKFHFVSDADIAGLTQKEFEAFDLMMGDYVRGIYARPERKSRMQGKPEKRSA